MKNRNLVIVESPAKAKTINKYLGKQYHVMASIGHVKDLPKTKFGVDIGNQFQPTYRVIRGKEKIVKEIRAAAAKAAAVYLAPDPDREGEAIAWHIASELKVPEERIWRVTFNEITGAAVKNAFEHPGKLDQNLVDAQQARRILDRIVGYSLSPFLGKKVKKGLSAGRVQSVALRLICEREEEIRAFTAREYWSLTARLRREGYAEFLAKLEKVSGKKAELATREDVDRVVAGLSGAVFTVVRVAAAERRRNPAPPFITSQLQQEAFRRLGFTAKKTMTLAQRLYEGVDLPGEGQVALITYMRTDSPRVSAEAQGEARQFVDREYGPGYLPSSPPVYQAKKRSRVEDAHECIRPTSMTRRPDQVRRSLERDMARLYELIWSRFVASQMTPARFDEVTADIEAAECLFRAKGSTLVFDGHLRAFADVATKNGDKDEEKAEGNGDETPEGALPPLTQGNLLTLLSLLPKQHFTQPPPRYTEASLIKALEEKGIGRPSTYAAILSTIQVREYTEKLERRFRPTELGELVNSLLVGNFPDIFNVDFTARMEDHLDLIEEGQRGWVETLREFHAPFQEDLERAAKTVEAVLEKTDIVCDQCGRPMVIRWGRKGRFLSCSAYPECKNAKNFERTEDNGIKVRETEATDIACDKCGRPMVIRWGRKGRFLSCSAYPECRNTKSFEMTGENGIKVVETEATGETCEKCGKAMVIRTGRHGKFMACSGYPACRNTRPVGSATFPCPQPGCSGSLSLRPSRKGRFWGCNRYPECRFACWGQPVAVACPACSAPTSLRKKGSESVLVCPRKECGHEFPAPEESVKGS